MPEQVRIVVEHFPDGYVAYPLGVRGVVIGQGETEEEAVADCRSALRFHLDTFGDDELEQSRPLDTHLVLIPL
jgi:predicted RNase H-like HicB family nuclease